MAAGSSAPELATVVIGVFCAQDDIAVFNIMFVISVCALCAGTVSHLNWWPLCRDCFFYAISILVMLSGVPAAVAAASAPYANVEGQNNESPTEPPAYNPQGAYDNAAYNAEPAPVWDPNSTWDPNNAWEETTLQQAGPTPVYNQNIQNTQNTSQTQNVQSPQTPGQAEQQKTQQLFYWYIAFPVHWSCRHTMPDCRGRWYPVTFVISMLWISFYSYFMVWMITVIGYTLGIPDTVMGLTFVAAGVSVW
ncbi:unnamed protein product [Leptidea sinapis]|uniref:Sodium/calcium exchanger membrane region domain-containing protein n=1 Tax=Leptidea sinapis TaxID=189913 RepID=A0A5E4QQ66_9NEOP|nr:unnamed protein product [Leptidea sinapis]